MRRRSVRSPCHHHWASIAANVRHKTDEGEYLLDHPILIESYATVEAIELRENLHELVRFAKRMGRDLNQDAVMLVIGSIMFYVKDYSGI